GGDGPGRGPLHAGARRRPEGRRRGGGKRARHHARSAPRVARSVDQRHREIEELVLVAAEVDVEPPAQLDVDVHGEAERLTSGDRGGGEERATRGVALPRDTEEE